MGREGLQAVQRELTVENAHGHVKPTESGKTFIRSEKTWGKNWVANTKERERVSTGLG